MRSRIGVSWANEVTEYALYLITLLTAPWLLRRGQHVRIDMVLVMVPPRVAWADGGARPTSSGLRQAWC